MPATIRLLCKDQYGNLATHGDDVSVGLLLVPQGKDAERKELIAQADSMDFHGAWLEVCSMPHVYVQE